MAARAERAKLSYAQWATAAVLTDSILDQPDSEGGGSGRSGSAYPPAESWGNAVALATARPDAELGRGARSALARAAAECAQGLGEKGKVTRNVKLAGCSRPGASAASPALPARAGAARAPAAGALRGLVHNAHVECLTVLRREAGARSSATPASSSRPAPGPAPGGCPLPLRRPAPRNLLPESTSELTAERARFQGCAPQNLRPAGLPITVPPPGAPASFPESPVTQEPAQVSCVPASLGTHTLCRGRNTGA